MNKPAAMPASRLGGAFKLLVLFAIEVGFIVAFHALGSIEGFTVDFANLSEWLDTTAPEVALVASIRIIALVFAYWMLATSLLYMVARSLRIPGLLRAMEFTTLPGVRRTIDGGLAAVIIGGTVFGGAGAVFAKQSDSAQKIAQPSAVEASYNNSRVLYNPTPTEDAQTEPVIEDYTQDAGLTSDVQLGEGKKIVAAPVDEVNTPQEVDSQAANRDPYGNYVPGPTEEPETPSEDTSITPDPTEEEEPSDTTTTSPKVVVPPTTDKAPRPTETTTPEPTTTAPKVTVPSTTAPVTTPEPPVTVDNNRVDRPTENPTEAPTQTPGSYTVVSGDNFWNIAREHVRSSLGREPSNAEVANYWVKLIDANRSTIRSGDPDLIFPGEVFTLPPL